MPADDHDPLGSTATMVRLGAIGAVMLVAAAAFGFVGGWFSPGRLTQKRMVAGFEEVDGPHPGFRRNHAKGLCATGVFESTGQAVALSKAAVFAPGRTPVVGRIAFAGGMPFVPDDPGTVRSLALRFLPNGAEEWRTGMIDIPVFPVTTAQAFYDQLLASKPDPATGKPDPARMKAYLDKHPESAAFMARMKAKPLAAGFANDSYNSVDGFVFVAPDGRKRLVRWSMTATDPFATLAPDVRAARADNYVFDDLLARVAQGPIRWRLVATIANPGDPNRAAEVWPEDRAHVEMGTLTITRVTSEAAGNCRDINFDPLVLPPGIEPSDDPIPFARSAVYATSFRRRAGEHHMASAVADRTAGVQ